MFRKVKKNKEKLNSENSQTKRIDPVEENDDISLNSKSDNENEKNTAKVLDKNDIKEKLIEKLNTENEINDNKFHDGFFEFEGNTFYFKDNKKVRNKNILDGKNIFNINNRGICKKLKNSWACVENDDYYVDSNGNIITGIQKLSDELYIFSENGKLEKNKNLIYKDNFYSINSHGKISIPKNSWVNIGELSWYVDENGKILKGFNTIDAKTYYFTEKEGLIKSSSIIDGEKFWVFDENGNATNPKNSWVNIADKKWYTDKDGNVLEGLYKIDDKFYFFTKEDGIKKDFKFISDKKFWISDKNGNITNPQNRRVGIGKKSWYVENDGKLLLGFQKIDDNLFYITEKNGILRNSYLIKSSKAYHFNNYGEFSYVKNQFITSGNDKYYAKDDSNIAKGVYEIDGENYYFSSDGKLMVNDQEIIDGKIYKTDENGILNIEEI